MKAFAAAGFATYAVDLRGYGATPRTADGWLTPSQSAEDVEAVLRYAADRHANLPAPILLGWSRGSKIAALTATRAKQPLSALVLYAFTFDPAERSRNQARCRGGIFLPFGRAGAALDCHRPG